MQHMQKVQKRDGRTVNFRASLITDAVFKALNDVGIVDPQFPHHVTEAVTRKLAGRSIVTIEEIQTIVEDTLMRSRYPAVARAYIQYRHDRDNARDARSDLSQKVLGLMNRTDRKLLTENANKDSRIISTQRDLLAGIVSKYFAKHYLPADVLDAHKQGILHFHDLDYSPFFPMYNCMLIDIKNMFDNGFVIGNAHISTPRSIATASTVITQIIAHVASNIYGGNTINRIDELLAPYVTMSYNKLVAEAKELDIDPAGYANKKIRKEVYDAVQCLEYQLNSLFSSNGQTPFCTFGFGLGESWESALVSEMILRVRLDGLGEEKITPVFPKLVFALKRGHNLEQDDPQYYIKRLALQCAAKRMYPDIVSYDKIVETTGSFKFPMGCRSFLGKWTDHNGDEVHEGRNNLGVVTLNIPRIALDANGDQETFWKLLDERMELVKRALDVRVERLREVTSDVAPILYQHGACGIRLAPGEQVFDKLFANGRASVSAGFIGLHEVSEIIKFSDDRHVFESKEKKDFLLAIVKRMKSFIERWKQEDNLAYSLYGTPSESLCYRFFNLDKEIYPDHPVMHDDGKQYWTNSHHLDVRYNANPYDKIDFERDFIDAGVTGGFISYGEYPNMRHNLDALEDVWDYAYDRTPYYGTNTPTDQCFKCQFEGEFTATSKGYECPKCGNHEAGTLSVIRRICGYLGQLDSRPANNGKQDEIIRRVKHL